VIAESLKDYKPLFFESNPNAESFKRALLSIIIATVFTKKYVKAYSFEKLKLGIQEYSKLVKAILGREPRYSGGGNYVRELKDDKIDIAKLGFIFALNDKTVSDADIVSVAKALGFSAATSTHLQYFNSKAFCQYLVSYKFPEIHTFNCNLTAVDKEVFSNANDFLDSGKALLDVEVNLTGTNKLLTPSGAQENESDKNHYFIAHYLNSEKRPLMATTIFKRKNRKVVQVSLTQFQDIAGRRPGIHFSSVEGGVFNGDGDSPLFVVQKSVPKNDTDFYKKNPQFQSLTISKEVVDGCCLGSFTSIVGHARSEELHYPVAGLVLLQEWPSEPNLTELTDLLQRYNSGRLPADDVVALEICNKIFQIRYRLHQSVFDYRKGSFENDFRSWTSLASYAGRYVCYYMRLSRPPAEFQTSRIEIFPDGSATLEQSPDDNTVTHGYVRVESERVWLYFGRNESIGEPPIRFILDDTAEDVETKKMRGTFQSETLKGQRLVSGLMSMTRVWSFGQEGVEKWVWPEFLAKKFHEVVRADFLDNSDFTFFTSGKVGGDYLSDGFAWADISDRLSPFSAVDRITRLIQGNRPGEIRNEFYYYTFKKDVNNSENLIERNLVRFFSNGTVHIIASEGLVYIGKAYFLKNTLRLSLNDNSGGFLEVFLKLNGDKASFQRIEILYGASLWHSDDRIQAKTVVLSRVNVRHFEEAPKFFYFETPEERDELRTEDVKSRGVISYLRGEQNRFLHSSKDPLANLFRPRDKNSREFHFYVACFYGYHHNIHMENGADITEEHLRTISRHIKNAFIHGFAVPFAGLQLSPKTDMKNAAEVQKAYMNHFFSGINANEKNNLLEKTPIQNIIKQIQEISEEQKFLVLSFQPGGPLCHEYLYGYARYFWPELLPERAIG
jgi:hypothetical protein